MAAYVVIRHLAVFGRWGALQVAVSGSECVLRFFYTTSEILRASETDVQDGIWLVPSSCAASRLRIRKERHTC